jgi:hypothetical protein
MDAVISQESFEFILEQLELDDHSSSWELSALVPQHKQDNTDTYCYWKGKQAKIRKAIRELKGL